jgi:hypothetical protein
VIFLDASARALLEVWALLDANARASLVDFANHLIERASFIGGPFDGHPVTDADREFPVHTFDHGPGRMAVYASDERGRFKFVGVRPNDDVTDDDRRGEGSGPSPWDDKTQGGAQ